MKNKLTRTERLAVWQLPAEQSEALAALAQRSMQIQVTVQDGLVWFNDGQRSVELSLQSLLT